MRVCGGAGQDRALASQQRVAIKITRGRLAQLVERLLYTQDVGGSSPSPPTAFAPRPANQLADGTAGHSRPKDEGRLTLSLRPKQAHAGGHCPAAVVREQSLPGPPRAVTPLP
jgi:hypothetical protein